VDGYGNDKSLGELQDQLSNIEGALSRLKERGNSGAGAGMSPRGVPRVRSHFTTLLIRCGGCSLRRTHARGAPTQAVRPAAGLGCTRQVVSAERSGGGDSPRAAGTAMTPPAGLARSLLGKPSSPLTVSGIPRFVGIPHQSPSYRLCAPSDLHPSLPPVAANCSFRYCSTAPFRAVKGQHLAGARTCEGAIRVGLRTAVRCAGGVVTVRAERRVGAGRRRVASAVTTQQQRCGAVGYSTAAWG